MMFSRGLFFIFDMFLHIIVSAAFFEAGGVPSHLHARVAEAFSNRWYWIQALPSFVHPCKGVDPGTVLAVLMTLPVTCIFKTNGNKKHKITTNTKQKTTKQTKTKHFHRSRTKWL